MDEENKWIDCIGCFYRSMEDKRKHFPPAVKWLSSQGYLRQRLKFLHVADTLSTLKKYEVNIKPTNLGIVISMQMENCNNLHAESETLNINLQEWQTFWISWCNGFVRMGQVEDYKPLLYLKVDSEHMMRFARFDGDIHSEFDLIIQVSPIVFRKTDYKILDGGDLRWERVENNILPLEAIVGGFEDEPLYIARADHNRSLCPGKYVKSKGMAFVPWGGREHSKTEFEVLCGHDYQWVKSKWFMIPENAFVAGRSEQRAEPLYVARARHEGYVITGKVHATYGTAYLPFQGKEVEVGDYEILVKPSVRPRGSFATIEY